MRRGALSYSKVRALTRVATPDTETRLLDFARCATAAHVERLVGAWRRVDRIAAAADDRRRHESRHLEVWVDEDGMLVVRGRMSPKIGAVVQRALEAASDRLSHDAEDKAEVSVGQRRADALGLVAESALDADLDRGTAGDRYPVVVPRGRGQPGRRRGGRAISAGRRHRRFRGDVSASRVRCLHGGHDSRARRDGPRCRAQDPHHSARHPVRSRHAIGGVAARAAMRHTATRTTCGTGRAVARRGSTTFSWCADVITEPCTRRDSLLNCRTTAGRASSGLTVASCPTFHRLPPGWECHWR